MNRRTQATLSAIIIAALTSAAPAQVTVGPRPSGALDGKIVYTHGGHGYTADNDRTGAWKTQRPLLLGMAEDLGNKDQMDCFVDELWRAGATIIPLRPVGHQPREAVVDNTDDGVEFFGEWTDSRADLGFGAEEGPAYRFAMTSAAESATALYQPKLTVAGVYPVYAWTSSGGNRAADQLYRVHHAGGATEVTVNHRRVGNGLVYLGSYHFAADGSGAVEISNRSKEPGKVVVADMIRFGNGRGDIDRGGGVSGLKREDEAGLYWVMWHVERARGVSAKDYRATDVDRTATISLSPRYSAFMNRESEGPATDRVFVSFHSNAGAGTSRGVLGLFNGNNYASSRTPHQLDLAGLVGKEINTDLVAQAGAFEHDWHDRGESVTLDRADIEFGELNNKYINDEFDATIIETGFHDNKQDAEMLRDPTVRRALARATCQGLVKYFNKIDGGQTEVVAAPPVVAAAAARSLAPGAVTVTWTPSTPSGHAGDAATGYVIYCSTDGNGYDAGTPVEGGATTRFTVTGLDPSSVYSFRVAARNAGGESLPSAALACVPSVRQQRLLIVDGYDRLDRTLNATEPYRAGGRVERVRPIWNNPGNYASVSAAALHAAVTDVAIDSATNEAVASRSVMLANYDAVWWSLGAESRRDHTFDADEQAAASAYVASGGNLFVSGSNVAWELDALGAGQSFCRDTLRAAFVADDAKTRVAEGTPGSLFEGVRIVFSDGSNQVDAASPDILKPVGGAAAALEYAGGAGAAGIQFSGRDESSGAVVLIGFPFELVEDAEIREEMASRVLTLFGVTGGE